MNRRNLLKSMLALPITAAAIGTYTFKIEPYWVEHVHLSMPIKNLPADLVGRTLVQISDLHVGNRFDWNYLIQAFSKIKTIEADFVVYTGDFVSYETEEQFGQLAQVLEHAPLGKLGSAAILGNHDYGHGWEMPHVADKISSIIADAGITILRNEISSLAGLNIVGIDDRWATNFSPSSVMSKVDATSANVVLCHNPDVVDMSVWKDESVWHGYEGWILAGHTHGGQVNPPFLPPPMLPVLNKRYTAGRFDLEDNRTLYINRALGCLWPVRFNARPEVTFFTLEAA